MLKYTGTALNQEVNIHRKVQGDDGREKIVPERIYPYLPDPELIKVVNLAILLERPLLLMGEPGCGKTRIAQAVAFELYHRQKGDQIERDYRDLYLEWNIKSTSKAREGLYEYDAIQRLGDAQVAGRHTQSMDELHRMLKKDQYIRKREMGLAFERSVSDDQRAVLLIDEIDKADIDFPNDLLNELDKGYFTITETEEQVVAPKKPIVFITSNAEKELPDAFLRRCLYHYIKPFGPEMYHRILNSRFYQEDTPTPKTELVEKAVGQFLELRTIIDRNKAVIGKSISTSELIDWFQALKHYQELYQQHPELHNKPDLKPIFQDLEAWQPSELNVPFRQVLFKNWNTIASFDKEKKT